MTPDRPDPLADRIRALADEAVAGTPLYVLAVHVRGPEGRRTVEVVADADAGAAIGDLSTLSRRLGFALDADDVVPGRYRLEVTSPGADAPLALPRQFPRHVGRDLRVTYRSGADVDGETVTVTGRLEAADAEALALALPGQADPVRIPFADLLDARVVLPW